MAEGKAVFAQANGRGKDLVEGPRAKAFVGDEPAIDQAGDGHAEDAFHRDAIALEIKFPGGAGGRRARGIDGIDVAGFGVVDQDEAIPAHARGLRFDHAQGRGRGNGRVNGIASGHHDLQARLRREVMARCHRAISAPDGRPVSFLRDFVWGIWRRRLRIHGVLLVVMGYETGEQTD